MSSCASIFCGSKAKVTFDGEISEEATLTIDGLKHTNVTFPYTTKIRRGFDETVVKIESPNYTASPIIINKNFNAVSVINLLDVLGWGIDAATGAITKPEFKFYQIDFNPKRRRRKHRRWIRRNFSPIFHKSFSDRSHHRLRSENFRAVGAISG